MITYEVSRVSRQQLSADCSMCRKNPRNMLQPPRSHVLAVCFCILCNQCTSKHKSIFRACGYWIRRGATRMHKLSSSGVLRDGVARLQAPGGADVRVEMSHPPQNRHAACVPPPQPRTRMRA